MVSSDSVKKRTTWCVSLFTSGAETVPQALQAAMLNTLTDCDTHAKNKHRVPGM